MIRKSPTLMRNRAVGIPPFHQPPLLRVFAINAVLPAVSMMTSVIVPFHETRLLAFTHRSHRLASSIVATTILSLDYLRRVNVLSPAG